MIVNWCAVFIQIQMSTVERKNLLDYLPPEEKQKILTLIQRLKEQTEAKQKYAALYNTSQKALNDVTQKFNKLKDQNSYLKQQIHNSFSMVSQVRAAFKANKQKLSNQKDKKQTEEEWEDDSDQQFQQNKQQNNQNLLVNHPPRPNHKSPLQKYRPQLTSSKKFNNNILNLSTADPNNGNLSASKNKELEQLRKQVRALQDSKKKSNQKKKQYEEKRKLVDQIKNRYKSGDRGSQIVVKAQHQESHIQKIDISETFQNDLEFSATKQRKEVQIVKKYEKQPLKNISAKPQSSFFETKQSKQKMVTNQDYGDVLQMINSYNL